MPGSMEALPKPSVMLCAKKVAGTEKKLMKGILLVPAVYNMKAGTGKSNGHAIIDTIYGLQIIESPSRKDYSDFPLLLSMK